MLFQKDGANNLRAIFNRFSVNGNPELDVALNVGDWVANQYYHVAYTWNSEKLELFVNGKLVNTDFFSYPIPTIGDAEFRIGSDGGGTPLNGMLDELRISNVVRSASEIEATFAAGFSSVTSIDLSPASFSLYVSWEKILSVNITTNLGFFSNIGPGLLDWSSGNDNIASVDMNGVIVGVGEGMTNITGQLNSFSEQVNVTVTAPVLPPEYETVDSYLATPECAVEFVPTVIIRYMPTTDGVNVDTDETGWTSTLTDLKTRIETFDQRLKFGLTEATKFRGYANPSAEAYLGFYVVDVINVYEPMPRGIFRGNHYHPDYKNILERFDAEDYVNNQGVKQFWLWGYHHGEIVPVESNMSSPTTGDISNSFREEDLPIYNHTYILYNYNFTRTQAEAMHNHGHQLEAMLSYQCHQQDGNDLLFWENFVGRSGGNPPLGRCGDTHHPPNTTTDYDYLNTALVESDIEDWKPDNSGAKKMVNVDTWGNLSFNWPGASDFSQRIETQWYMYWMQSMPGNGNSIPHGANWMSNWWKFVGDWDATTTANMGLYSAAAAQNLACSSALATDFIKLEAINLDKSILLKWQISNKLETLGFELGRKTKQEADFKTIAYVDEKMQQSNNYQFEDKQVTVGKTYYYQLTQKNESGKVHVSNIVTAKIWDNSDEIQLFPNPTAEKLNIVLPNLNSQESIPIEIWNVQGQIVKTILLTDKQTEISVEELKGQVYWVRLFLENRIITKKIVVRS